MEPARVLILAHAQSGWAAAVAKSLHAAGFWCLCLDRFPSAYHLVRGGGTTAVVVALALRSSHVRLLARMRELTALREVVVTPFDPLEPDLLRGLVDAQVRILRNAAPSDVVAHLVRICGGARC